MDWYDIHAREMPWRMPPTERASGSLPDPYRIWLSEIMLQQTTVVAVKEYFIKFITLWPNVFDLAMAKDADVMAAWAGLGYYARARNLLKCARIIAADYGGIFPQDRAQLQELPGIGPYTSAAVASIAFDHVETVVDGNVERVMSRLFDVHVPLPTSKGMLTELAKNLTPKCRSGDYAQAVMDLGATVCSPKSPRCVLCPWADVCLAHKKGTAVQLPKKLKKPLKTVRLGIAYVALRSNQAVLLEKRPDRGLLGGMLGWPGSDWTETEPISMPPFEANWVRVPGEVRHTFTHFHLRLQVMKARTEISGKNFNFVPKNKFRPEDLPTVMRKVWNLVVAENE